MKNQEKVADLIEKRVQAKLGGGEKRIASQHKKENSQHEKESICCSTKAASKSWICS